MNRIRKTEEFKLLEQFGVGHPNEIKYRLLRLKEIYDEIEQINAENSIGSGCLCPSVTFSYVEAAAFLYKLVGERFVRDPDYIVTNKIEK